jgi:hypothetical protein
MRSHLIRISSFLFAAGFIYLGSNIVLRVGPDATAQRSETAVQTPVQQPKPATDVKPKPTESPRHVATTERREELCKKLEQRREELKEEKKAKTTKKPGDARKIEEIEKD